MGTLQLPVLGALLVVNGWGMDGSIMLGKVLGQVYISGLNCARKIQLSFMDTKCAKEALAPSQANNNSVLQKVQ